MVHIYTLCCDSTRQGALILRQVKDLVEGTLLGAVWSGALLITADTTWDTGCYVTTGGHRLDLLGRWSGNSQGPPGRMTPQAIRTYYDSKIRIVRNRLVNTGIWPSEC